MRPIIVAYDGSPNAEDALAFGAFLARAGGAPLQVVCAYPIGGRAARSYDEAMRPAALDILESARIPDDVHARRVALPATSLGRALHDHAGERRAALVVLGSSRHGAAHRAMAGTVAGGLLHGSPCAVAVVPAGWRELGDGPRRVVVGYDGGPESEEALAAGRELAGRLGRPLALVKAAPSGYAVPAEWPMYSVPERGGHEAVERARRELEAVAARTGDPEAIETAVLEGDAGVLLREHVRPDDVLVLGSRGYGPIRSVLLGSVSRALAASCPCPVLVVPRSAEAPAADVAAEPAEPAAAGAER